MLFYYKNEEKKLAVDLQLSKLLAKEGGMGLEMEAPRSLRPAQTIDDLFAGLKPKNAMENKPKSVPETRPTSAAPAVHVTLDVPEAIQTKMELETIEESYQTAPSLQLLDTLEGCFGSNRFSKTLRFKRLARKWNSGLTPPAQPAAPDTIQPAPHTNGFHVRPSPIQRQQVT